MAKVVKTVRIEESLVEKLGDIAEQEFGGNATAALEAIIGQAADLRVIPEVVRWSVYSKVNEQILSEMGVQRGTQEEYKLIRSITSALGI